MGYAAFILWLEGVRPEDLSAVPAVARMAESGADLRLDPLPLAERSLCYYQTLTGIGSGKLGRFDAVRPDAYFAREDAGMPEGAAGRLLPDLLKGRKLAVEYVDADDASALDRLAMQDGRCALARLRGQAHTGPDALDATVRRTLDLAGPEAYVVVLTDVWSPEPTRLANVNDFLADAGLLEVGTPRGRVGVVWPESLAFGLGTGQVWVNLRGREPQGAVGAGQEYAEVRNALVRELSEWRDGETGARVVNRALKKEEAYSGDYLFKAPDVIIEFAPGYAASPHAAALEFDGTPVIAGSGSIVDAPHARLVASGPALTAGYRGAARLVDVTPTILYLLGQPVPSYMDGGVMSAPLRAGYTDQHPVRTIDATEGVLSEEDESLILNRLGDLGYLG